MAAPPIRPHPPIGGERSVPRPGGRDLPGTEGIGSPGRPGREPINLEWLIGVGLLALGVSVGYLWIAQRVTPGRPQPKADQHPPGT